MWLQLNVLKEKGKLGIEDSSELLHLMDAFPKAFDTQNELPPRHVHDHVIRLQPESKVPNIRPYQYPYYQKNGIEKIVKELFATGIIKASTSPFSSPLLLVKKKDGSWHF